MFTIENITSKSTVLKIEFIWLSLACKDGDDVDDSGDQIVRQPINKIDTSDHN